ncbi:type II secretion system F family protein [Pseudoxanthomonas sp. LjRoot127]
MAAVMDASSASFVERVDIALRKFDFSTDKRKELYRTLGILLKSGQLLREALDELYNVHSDAGKKPKRAIAAILSHVSGQVSNGSRFSDAIRMYVSFDEYAILNAGEQSGDLLKAFAEATKVAEAKGKMLSAVLMGASYPIVLFLNLGFLLWVVQAKLVPALVSAADPQHWSGPATVLYYMAKFVSLFGIPVVILTVVGLFAFVYALPRLTGTLRYYLDKLPGFDTYRAMSGAIFLLTIAGQIRHKIKLHDALTGMAEVATPYMYERISGAIAGTNDGKNLGAALEYAGYDFPDKEAIRLVKALGNRQGFEESLATYANEWIEKSVSKVQKTMRVFLTVALIAVGGTMLCIVGGTQGIKDAVEASYR